MGATTRERKATPCVLVTGIAILGILLLAVTARQYSVGVARFEESLMQEAQFRVEGLALTQEALIRSTVQSVSRSLAAVTTEHPDSLSMVLQTHPIVQGVVTLDGRNRVTGRAGFPGVPQPTLVEAAAVLRQGVYEHRNTSPPHATILAMVQDETNPALLMGIAVPDLDEPVAIAIIDTGKLGDTLDIVERISGVSVALAMKDRTVLVRRPVTAGAPAAIPYDPRDPPVITRRTVSPFDGRQRQVSVRTIDPWPLVVAVTEDLQPALERIADYRRREALRWSAVSGITLVLLLFLGYLVVRYVAATEQLAEREAPMRHMAQHDGLTGLPNRELLSDRLHQALAMAERSGTRLAVMYMDLNSFKQINDTLGHHVGDEVLKSVAMRIISVLRASDTAARVGGDEFVVLLSTVENRAAAELVGRKLVLELEHPMEIREHTVQITAGIGVAMYPEDGTTDVDLMRIADAAMYRNKHGAGDLSPAPAQKTIGL